MLSRIWHYTGGSGAVAGSLFLGLVCSSAPARANTYSFDNYLNATNDFSISSGGQTAKFSSTSGPAPFTVNQSADLFSFPVALGGFGNFNGDPLTISFTDPAVEKIIIPFGIFEPYATASVTLVATSNTGQSAQFATTSFNTINGSPEGVVTFIPVGPISSLTLNSPNAFAIANVALSSDAGGTTAVPEPVSAALLGGGLVIAGLTRRRRGIVGPRSN